MPLWVHRVPPSRLFSARGAPSWTQSARRSKSGCVAKRRRKFQYPDCPLREAMCSVGRRTSLFWIVHGRTRISTSLQSLHGVVSGNPPSLIIGFDAWQLNSIALRNSSLDGLSTGRGQVEALRLRMNFLTLLSPGLEIQIQGSEQRGRRERGSRSWSRIGEPYWCWMVWSRCKIRPVHKKDGYVNLRSKRSYANSLPSLGALRDYHTHAGT